MLTSRRRRARFDEAIYIDSLISVSEAVIISVHRNTQRDDQWMDDKAA